MKKLREFDISNADQDNVTTLTAEQKEELQETKRYLATLYQRRKEIEIQLKKEKKYGSKALSDLENLQIESESTVEKAEVVGLPVMNEPSESILRKNPEMENTYRTYQETVNRKYEIDSKKIDEVIKLKKEKNKIEASLGDGDMFKNFIEILGNISKTTDDERKEITTLFEYFGMFEQNSDVTVQNSVEETLNKFVKQSTPSKKKEKKK